jgi:hypothetical protein
MRYHITMAGMLATWASLKDPKFLATAQRIGLDPVQFERDTVAALEITGPVIYGGNAIKTDGKDLLYRPATDAHRRLWPRAESVNVPSVILHPVDIVD